MEFELTKSKRIICMFLIFIVTTYLSACDSRAGSYPFLEEAEWVCNDPGFTLTYSRASNGTMDATEILEWNNDTIEVDLEFRSSFFCASPENSADYDERLFTGTWKYRNGDLVLIIDEDFIFNNRYSELVFSRSSPS